MDIQCCKCRRVQKNNDWVRPETAERADVSHTYCPDCLEETLMEFRREYPAMTRRVPQTLYSPTS